MQTVLLMGGRSFIGGHVCRVLINHGYKVILHSTTTPSFDNLLDVLPHPQVQLATCAYDETEKMKNLVAASQYVIFSARPPGKQTLGKQGLKERELEHIKSFLDILLSSSIKKSVFISTCSTIAQLKEGLADESCIAHKKQGWAGIAFKFRLENLVMDYFKKGLNIVVVNPTKFVGLYDTRPSTGEFFQFIDKAPFSILKDSRINIVDAADAAMGTVLALEKGRAGERYILSGNNILFGDLIARIRKCGGKKVPTFDIPYVVCVVLAVISELINLVLRRERPFVPLIGIELTKYGTQHFSYKKAQEQLGYQPADAWLAVDRAYEWYKKNGIL